MGPAPIAPLPHPERLGGASSLPIPSCPFYRSFILAEPNTFPGLPVLTDLDTVPSPDTLPSLATLPLGLPSLPRTLFQSRSLLGLCRGRPRPRLCSPHAGIRVQLLEALGHCGGQGHEGKLLLQGRAGWAVSTSTCPCLQASLHPLTVCPLGAGPHRGTGCGQGRREPRRATITGESGSRTMTRHGRSDLFLGPCKELLSLWGPLSGSQKPLDWRGRNDQMPSHFGKLKSRRPGVCQGHTVGRKTEELGLGLQVGPHPRPRARVADTATAKPPRLLLLPLCPGALAALNC